ncbi:DUF732 domain-containing protein [Mycobacterium spongiae]|uniref:DUF732 domain-containing protein n=1 Tax=Mycobacterium spongiae TaxID=886343 RepID=A0A975PWZ7_9MYCO|nr:DUF732 domain-containing protein [Mycobacterium spongiae]QUR67572.1 DUF732 domain-containing protein [Mycobacterium spongiae]
MKALLAVLSVATMVGLAAPAYGHPGDGTGDDAGFLAALDGAGITYGDPARAIGSAQAVCTCLNNGESGLELVHDVKVRNPGLDMEAASQFAVLSATYYCPHHLTEA